MSGPWEKYQQPNTETATGPWNKYGNSPSVELPAFPIDDHINNHVKDMPIEKQAEQKGGFVSFLGKMADPWLNMGYSTASSLNRGMAHFTDTMDLLGKFVGRTTGASRGGIFEAGAKSFNENAKYWQDKADKNGISFMEELLGEATGGAVPGVAEFTLNVASGLSIPAISGGEKAKEHEQDPVIGGLLEAAKTGTLAGMFKMIQPFSRFIQASMMGTTFGLMGAAEAPEGQKLKEGFKGVGTGLLFSSMSSPGGVKIRDIYPEIGNTMPEFRKGIENEAEGNKLEEDHIEKPAEAKKDNSDQSIKGVGAAAVGKNFDPDISDLTNNLKNVPKDTSFEDKLDIADKLKKEYTGVMGKAKTALSGLKNIYEVSKDWYLHRPEYTTFDNMFNKYLGGRDMTGMKVDKFSKSIQKSMPDRQQKAITNWILANGDEATLRDRAEKTTDPENKKGYEDALKLSTEAKGFAESIRQYWNRKLDENIEAGILDHGVENYVHAIVKGRPEKDTNTQRLLSESNSGMLRKNPSYAKKRIFDTLFDGEQEGYSYEKRIGYLIADYEKSFGEAVNARGFIKSLTDGDATDGRPLAVTMGGGTPLPKGETPAESYLIKPRAISIKKVNEVTGEKENIDTTGYKTISHPALRNYKWATKDNDGNPIFVEGELLVHPEAYKKLDALLGKSAIKENVVGRNVLKGSSEVKGTLLGFFSTFHQVGLAQHMLTHGVSPFSPPEIDLENPLTKSLIEHTLKVYDGDGMSSFREGLTGPGLIKYIPKLGPFAEQYTEYLFGNNGYIPRAKVHLAETLYARNKERYPELNEDQVLKLSADQANGALGGQNNEALGRSKTMQDLLRLAGLAPDFLESRMKFTGQALKPYGREQLTAVVVRGAIGMYVIAKTIEGIASMIDDNNSVHYKRPFSVTIDDKEYSLRSMQGDLWHLVSDPRSFVYYRLNPIVVKPAIEAITGRDNWGRKKDAEQQLKDLATTAVPIAGQGFFHREDYSLWQSIMQSMGVSSWNAETEAQKMMKEIGEQKAAIKKEIDEQKDPDLKKLKKKHYGG